MEHVVLGGLDMDQCLHVLSQCGLLENKGSGRALNYLITYVYSAVMTMVSILEGLFLSVG